MTYAPERELLRTRRLTTLVNGRPMTQFDVCRKIKTSQAKYSQIERGLTKPSPDEEKKLVKMFNLPEDYFDDEPEQEAE